MFGKLKEKLKNWTQGLIKKTVEEESEGEIKKTKEKEKKPKKQSKEKFQEEKKEKKKLKKLFEAVIAVAKKMKVRKFEWQVLDWNKPAINFYKKYNTVFEDKWVNCKLVFE